GGGSALFDAPARHLPESPGIADYYRQLGSLRANIMINKTGGNAKILHVAFHGVTFGEYLSEGFREGIAACGGCEVVGTLKVAPADVSQLRQKFESALLKVPSATAVAVDVNFFFVAGVQQALVAANRPNLAVVGGECQLENLDYIRSGKGEQVCIGGSNGYRAYGTIDALNRAFNGQPVVPSGSGFQIVDKDRNLPAEGANYEGPVDFRDRYRKLWGV
ncbi:hypothetical protein AB0873_29100, partial [Micromonospora sp. NPDC047707]|uniref:hypothetical protein n=1 Tax=Micromonospora sp. NPDC047707 TaxID=3154498 RepID=UPI003455305D